MARWNLTAEERMSEALLEVNGPLSTPCWLWQKSTKWGGYGQMWFEGKIWLTHRLSWFLHYGEIPTTSWVLHKCDRPSCCNPKHLFLGTAQDNNIDCYIKDRNPNKKITCEQIANIKMMNEQGFKYAHIAKTYNISPGYIWVLIRGKERLSDDQ